MAYIIREHSIDGEYCCSVPDGVCEKTGQVPPSEEIKEQKWSSVDASLRFEMMVGPDSRRGGDDFRWPRQ